MNATLKLAALAIALTFATSASAGLTCKNSNGQEINWQSNGAKPDLADFDITAAEIVCYVNGWLQAVAIPNSVSGLPYVKGIPQGSQGIMYRGDSARWLLENLPAVSGLPATGDDYRARGPN